MNLALADILYATLLTPKVILRYTFTHPEGVTGTILCRLVTGGSFGWVGGASSAFTLLAISLERYYTVMYPLGNKGKLTKRKLKVHDKQCPGQKDVFTYMNNVNNIKRLISQLIRQYAKQFSETNPKKYLYQTSKLHHFIINS